MAGMTSGNVEFTGDRRSVSYCASPIDNSQIQMAAPEAVVFHLLSMLFGGGNPLGLRRLLRYFTVLLTAALIASIIANPPRFELSTFDWRDTPVMWTVILLVQLLWVFVDLIPSLKERKRPSQ